MERPVRAVPMFTHVVNSWPKRPSSALVRPSVAKIGPNLGSIQNTVCLNLGLTSPNVAKGCPTCPRVVENWVNLGRPVYLEIADGFECSCRKFGRSLPPRTPRLAGKPMRVSHRPHRAASELQDCVPRRIPRLWRQILSNSEPRAPTSARTSAQPPAMAPLVSRIGTIRVAIARKANKCVVPCVGARVRGLPLIIP